MIALLLESALPPSRFPGLATLLSRGFHFPVTPGATIREALETGVRIPSDYVRHRIQTVFLNSKPVDDMDAVRVSDGDTLSLSAAMPGLVGATFRKGGFYAAFREGISRHENRAIPPGVTGYIEVRLFNFVAREIGPLFLHAGIRLSVKDLSFYLNGIGSDAMAAVTHVVLNGSPVSWEALIPRLQNEENIFLKILFPNA